MSNKIVSYFLHAFAGIIIAAYPLFTLGVPDSWQSMTVAAVMGLIFKWAHDVAGF